jgi:hypothetical protein
MIEEPSEEEKKLWKKSGVKLLQNHIDVWRICDCGFRRHETWVRGELMISSEYGLTKI